MCEYRTSSPRRGRTLVACRCFIATAFFGGMNFFPFFMFCVFLFAFLDFSASFEVPWAIVVGEVFGRWSGCPFLSCLLAPLRPWLRRVCRICLGISLVFVRQRRPTTTTITIPFVPPLALPCPPALTGHHRAARFLRFLSSDALALPLVGLSPLRPISVAPCRQRVFDCPQSSR